MSISAALPEPTAVRSEATVRSAAVRALTVLASLKLTVVLFLLAMVIVFIGSLAQARRDVWLVMADYFRCYVAKVDVVDLFPPSMFGRYGEELGERLGSFRYLPFPGGWTIGWIMLANLTSAHVLKFRIQATGKKRLAGFALTALGLIMMAVVVITGNQQTGVESGNTILSAEAIWYLMLGLLGLSGAATIVTGLLNKSSARSVRGLLLVLGATIVGVFIYYVVGGEQARLNLSAMRILWQLLKGSACSLLLLLGSNLLFGKRGGIALLHFGVAMLMISELQVGLIAREYSLSLTEGETVNYARDIRVRELAVISRRNDGKDNVVAIPEAMLVAAAPEDSDEQKPASGMTDRQLIATPELPFDIVVRRFYRNSELRGLTPDDSGLKEGLGSFAAPEERDPVTGMDDTMDQSTVLVDLVDRDSQKTLQTMLVSQSVSELSSQLAEKATVDGTDYYFYLRFQRDYKPYEVHLLDVSRTTYIGSSTPRDFRSEIEITQDGKTESFTIWMNNPLRYQGETFYQSNYLTLPDGREASTISVVRNSGWMLPYIACMVVAFGMFAQFGQTLMRFLDRSERRSAAPAQDSELSGNLPAGFAPAKRDPVPAAAANPEPKSALRFWLPLTVTAVFVLWVGRSTSPPKPTENTFNLYQAAQLPVAWNGRAQPIDSVARTMLLMASHKSTFMAELEPWQLEEESVRTEIIAAAARSWPDGGLDAALKEFQGSCPEWYAEIGRLADVEPGEVEKVLRPLMERKSPAIKWFLDLAARPEIAGRHRVIRIEDDRLLSLLDLEQRPGLAYSMDEVRRNMSELEDIWQEGNEKRRRKEEYDLTVLERRVGALFDTFGRINQVSQMFLRQDSDNPIESAITTWRILSRMGESRAVMAVPTGTADELKSWETYIVSSSLQALNRELQGRDISSLEQFTEYVQTRRPLELVRSSIPGTMAILESTPMQEELPEGESDTVQSRALSALNRVQDPYLRNILQLIADSDPEVTPQQLADTVTAAQAAELAADRVAQDMMEVISELMENSPDDPRMNAIRGRLQAVGVSDPDALYAAVNQEICKLLWDDLQQQVGPLMNGGDASETFMSSVGFVSEIFDAWRASDVALFNEKVAAYQGWIKESELPFVDADNVRLEAWFNFVEPFQKAIYIYLPIVVVVFLGWMFPLGGATQRTGLWMLVLAFVVHTAALVLRMQISGRPPVTNLYSSAIFIGWAVVIAAFVVEIFMKNGVGSLVGASVGSGALVIAHYLSLDEGDTLGTLQAVLDTTFWLATHVVCITLGYAATFFAGFLGVAWAALSLFRGNSPRLPQIGRMIYGVLCFALFFSLVGTVLGGLWADDSWGRFWGWDPKENGAMLIVLWNALILHARWDKQVGDFGTSMLAMIGNIVTAWSWFGVNELRAGLHSYGFTEGRLFALGMFFAVQGGLLLLFMFLRPLAKQRALSQAGT